MWIDDDILLRCAEPLAHSIWVPQQPVVVLGSSNYPDVEVQVDSCQRDGIPILKRYGGGGTVLLYDGCVIVSLGLWVRQHYQNKLYFECLNQAVIDALGQRWSVFRELGQRGLSDITFGDLKVAGTSLFRSRNYLLYQASILVDLRPDLIDLYLKHPSREPDYRLGRTHKDFLTGLSFVNHEVTPTLCATELHRALPECVRVTLGNELVMPISDQFPALHARVQRANVASQSGAHLG